MPVPGKPTQDFIPIRDIRNGVIILNSGDLRMILMTSSLNFGLKSAEEQGAILYQFQSVLNSLEFPIQISIQSKRLDIRPYLKMLEEREKAQLIDAMKIQVHEYIAFIRDFTGKTNIMSKNFFIIIPYAAAGIVSSKPQGGGMFSGLFGGNKGPRKMTESETNNFEEARIQLEQRVGIVEQGLGRCDLRTVRLGTEEITEMFYKKFNPGELEASV